MKTIAITIDEQTLEALDRLSQGPGRKTKARAGNRSKLVRQALQEFLARAQKAEREQAEWQVWSKNIDRLNRDAAAAVADQAEP